MPPYSDVYVLAPMRSAEAIEAFLSRFAPSRDEPDEIYSVPQFADSPSRSFPTLLALLRYLDDHPQEPYALYWRNRGEGPPFVMVFHTADGGLILGISVEEPDADGWSTQLMEFSGSRTCLLRLEEPPPDTKQTFRVLTGEATSPPG